MYSVPCFATMAFAPTEPSIPHQFVAEMAVLGSKGELASRVIEAVASVSASAEVNAP